MNFVKKTICVVAMGAASLTVTTVASADEWPLVQGSYWEVTGINVKDGGGLKYAAWLASEWKKNLEFSKSKGWIKDYKIFANAYARAGEPDLYLVRIVDSVVSGAEGEKRQAEYREWQKKTIAQMDAESGNRAEYREVMGTNLLQEMTFR